MLNELYLDFETFEDVLTKVSFKAFNVIVLFLFISSTENNAYSFGRTTIANLDAEWVILRLSLYYLLFEVLCRVFTSECCC